MFKQRCRLYHFVGFLFLAIAFSPGPLFAQHDFSKNSTAKKRVKPNATAARIGSGVEWRKSVEEALQEAHQTGKPVFWYVPTVRGTFMDRKDSIDRYMLAGPFSWPQIIDLINENFVPVKATPKQSQQQQYDIKPYVFVEPGFVILRPDDSVTAKIDRLTTLHPDWLLRLISSFADSPKIKSRPETLERLWAQFAAGDYQNMAFFDSPAADEQVELLLLSGMVDHRRGDHQAAIKKWEQAASANPESPLAWKAAAEAQGIGPFVRGFEVHRDLPDAAFQAGLKSAGSAAPTGVYTETELWQRGIEFLLGMQSSNGGWFDSDYDFGGTDSLPNVYVAVSAIAAMALWEAQSHPALQENLRPRIEAALKQAMAFLQDDSQLNRSDRDELMWAYAYRIRFWSRVVPTRPEFRDALAANVSDLESMQLPSGGWFHEYPNPMVTSLALIAFAESTAVGVPAKEETISRGVTSLTRDRFGNGGFRYSSARGQNPAGAGGEDELKQSAGRMPLGEVALWLHGGSHQDRLLSAIEHSFTLAEPLMKSLKYDNHTSNYAYGGFFIWYDIEARGEAILQLKDETAKRQFQQLQKELILGLPEVDGCFVDSHELGRVYGTAMALLSLAKTDQTDP